MGCWSQRWVVQAWWMRFLMVMMVLARAMNASITRVRTSVQIWSLRGLLGVFRTVLVFLLQAAFVKPRNSRSTSFGVRYPRAE